MRRWLYLFVLLLASQAQARVDAAHYDAFWLWAGVNPQPVLATARTLYLLQGQISSSRSERHRQVNFVAQGMPVSKLPQAQVWIVYRAHTLRWPEPVYRQMLGQLKRWRESGSAVVGLQLDFDARTRHLDEYVEFLRDLRQRLPPEYRLSITGLLDWSSNADVSRIALLRGVVDEVVVQTYQGRQSIADYGAYLPRLDRLGLPYRIGLIQGGDWQAPGFLQRSAWFRGYVVFLQNP